MARTALYDLHKTAKAKMVPFGGWDMPVSYTSVLAEHKAVREQCGLFDVSHMGEVMVTGKGAAAFLQAITVNDVAKLGDGRGQYSALLKPDGGMIDDIILYRLTAERFLICVNASNADKDYAWIREQAKSHQGVIALNESDQWSQLAVQGPRSKTAVAALIGPVDRPAFDALEYMQIMAVNFFGRPSYVARTGYTGEWGYELYIPNDVAQSCWLALLETKSVNEPNKQTGLQPIGLGARDTLRLEACYLLYGNDMDETVSPLEAGIAWAVKLDKGDFVGRAALIQQKERGLERSLLAFKMEGDGIPRHGMEVFVGDAKVGVVTSGSVLPTVGGAGGLALVDPRKVRIGDAVEVDVRGKRKLARLVKKPLYNPRVRA